MCKIRYVMYLFRLLCSVLFLYQAGFCIYEYTFQEVASKTYFENQENYPRPSICITTEKFKFADFNNSLNISHKEYIKGKWKVGNVTEEEMYDFLTPKFSDLVTKIEIGNLTKPVGDEYDKIILSVDESTNFEEEGIEIQQLGHYYHLKCYCLNLRLDYF